MFKRADWVHTKKGRGGGLEDSSSSSSDDDDEPIYSSVGEADDSDEEEDDDDDDNSEEDDSGEELLVDRGDGVEQDGQDGDHLSDDDDMDVLEAIADICGDDEEMQDMCAMKQADKWYEAGEQGKVLKGRALTCVPCARKKKVLLLNSVMLYKHMESGQHRKVLEREDPADMIFRYADTYTKKGLVTGGETHHERLQRIKAEVGSIHSSAKKKKTKMTKANTSGNKQKTQRSDGKTEETEQTKDTSMVKESKEAQKAKGQKKRKTRPGKRQRQELKEARAREEDK